MENKEEILKIIIKKEEEKKIRKSPNSRPTILLPRGNYYYQFLYPSRNFLCMYK